MAWAEGYVQDATSGSGIPYATLYDYIDGYWAANSLGWWATPNAYPGLVVTGSAGGHNPQSVTLNQYQNDPAVGQVLWAVIKLQTAPPPSSGGSGHSGW